MVVWRFGAEKVLMNTEWDLIDTDEKDDEGGMRLTSLMLIPL